MHHKYFEKSCTSISPILIIKLNCIAKKSLKSINNSYILITILYFSNMFYYYNHWFKRYRYTEQYIIKKNAFKKNDDKMYIYLQSASK